MRFSISVYIHTLFCSACIYICMILSIAAAAEQLLSQYPQVSWSSFIYETENILSHGFMLYGEWRQVSHLESSTSWCCDWISSQLSLLSIHPYCPLPDCFCCKLKTTNYRYLVVLKCNPNFWLRSKESECSEDVCCVGVKPLVNWLVIKSKCFISFKSKWFLELACEQVHNPSLGR